jgi:uncharacterized protein Yka (UPF0111/DUF47 family)
MPGDPKECREHAVRCLELARTASSPEARDKFISLAATWQQLASELETAMALLESAKEAVPGRRQLDGPARRGAA